MKFNRGKFWILNLGQGNHFSSVVTSDRTWVNGLKLCRVGFEKKVLDPEGGWALEQDPQGSDQSPKPDRRQEVFGQCSQAHDSWGWSCAGPGAGLYDLYGSLSTQLTL
ncbi:hypothetical protein DUI87_30350 [Hirundo rustica rustica]|uniref:Uncharacterized protein n=1 Tax=Hirundo rustica rustica TaxID=333673 RepID=A0A3M0IXJ9_HIRRU|nr:hypothetical protein DUI87_30350 [Hirundo rustica rustica]